MHGCVFDITCLQEKADFLEGLVSKMATGRIDEQRGDFSSETNNDMFALIQKSNGYRSVCCVCS